MLLKKSISGLDSPIIWEVKTAAQVVTPTFTTHVHGSVIFMRWLQGTDEDKLLFVTVNGWVVLWKIISVSRVTWQEPMKTLTIRVGRMGGAGLPARHRR